MEYDLDTFLDEYQPLFKSEHHKQNYMTRFEQLKKRYFSGRKMYIFIKRLIPVIYVMKRNLQKKSKKIQNLSTLFTRHSGIIYGANQKHDEHDQIRM